MASVRSISKQNLNPDPYSEYTELATDVATAVNSISQRVQSIITGLGTNYASKMSGNSNDLISNHAKGPLETISGSGVYGNINSDISAMNSDATEKDEKVNTLYSEYVTAFNTYKSKVTVYNNTKQSQFKKKDTYYTNDGPSGTRQKHTKYVDDVQRFNKAKNAAADAANSAASAAESKWASTQAAMLK